jgi:hypothetical protein
VRGSGRGARLAAVAVVVLSALVLVTLTARSGRTETVRPITSPTPIPEETPSVSVGLVDEKTPPPPPQDSSRGMPDLLLLLLAVLALGLIAVSFLFWTTVLRAGLRLPGSSYRGPPPAGRGAVPDEVDPAPLADAVDAGLRRLEDGSPGEGIVACWVQLERAAADAGTHRAAPDTPSELAGRLIDRHDVTPGPLLRLADLYREARYSRHRLPESARDQARAALEAVRAELEASVVGSRREAP